MATVAETQAELDVQGTGKLVSILKSVEGATTRECYCLGGTDRPGKARWVTVTIADDAATQAAAILLGLV